MYARTVPTSVKARAVEAFAESIESEIIPFVRRLKGFHDALTLIVPGGREGIGISAWSRRVDAHRNGRCTEKKVMSRLTRLLDECGTAKTFRLPDSTIHKIGTRVPL